MRNDIDENFLHNHLRTPIPSFSPTAAMLELVETIQTAGSKEEALYSPAAKLLTSMSEVLYGMSHDCPPLRYAQWM